jgi:hypothetical protein
MAELDRPWFEQWRPLYDFGDAVEKATPDESDMRSQAFKFWRDGDKNAVTGAPFPAQLRTLHFGPQDDVGDYSSYPRIHPRVLPKRNEMAFWRLYRQTRKDFP